LKRARALKWVAGLLVLVGIVLAVLRGLSPSPSGPISSSYATTSEGLSAYARLLADTGHTVTQLRTPPARATLDPGKTLVMLDPNLVLPADVTALKSFIAAGGRLIAGGRDPGAWLSELLPGAPQWSPTGASSAANIVPVPETAEVSLVQTAGAGSWSDPRGTLPALGQPSASLLTVVSVRKGRIALLADASPLQNGLLAEADDAALGLALAGPRGRPVTFEEGVHGYGARHGLAALPQRWKWALIGLALAALIAVAARIRRLGPPEPPAPAALPPRRAYVEALAVALGRTRRPAAAAAGVHSHSRSLVMRRTGITGDADSEEIAAAAHRLGLDPEEVRVVAGAKLSDGDLLVAGRALAKLSGAHA
jgi:hypothetical protein